MAIGKENAHDYRMRKDNIFTKISVPDSFHVMMSHFSFLPILLVMNSEFVNVLLNHIWVDLDSYFKEDYLVGQAT